MNWRKQKRTLQVTHMKKHLQREADGTVWAWYRLGPHSWSLKSLVERDRIWEQQANAWASLSGRRVRVRLSSVPFPANKWAESFHANNPNRLPDVEGAMSWEDMLVAQQKRIRQHRASRSFRVVGVRLSLRCPEEDWEGVVNGNKVRVEMEREIRELDRIMLHPGFTTLDDNRLVESEMWWLMHRSVGIGFQPPKEGLVGASGWEPQHMPEFTDPVNRYQEPGDRSIRVDAVRDGKKQSKWVVVRDLIRAGQSARDSSSHTPMPWLATLDAFDFDVEVSATLDIIPGKRLEKTMEARQMRAAYIKKHTRDSGRISTHAQDAAIAQAGRALDDVTRGTDDVATRVYGNVRFAVAGDSEEMALDRARTLAEYYSTEQKMQLVERKGQFGRLREFIPGERVTQMHVDMERMTCHFWATSWPGAEANVGDSVGPYTGYITGTAHRSVQDDPHNPTLEFERSSAFAVSGTLGSGKSYTIGGKAALSARMGRHTLLTDPDGRLVRLADVPELKPYSRVINLTGRNAVPGMLNPYTQLPDPRREHFDDEADWEAEKRQVAMQRRQLVTDAVLSFVHPSIAKKGARGQVMQALNLVGSEYGHSPWEVVDALLKDDATAPLGREIAQTAESPAGILAFGDSRTRDVDAADDFDMAMLTIITAAGLETPDPTKPKEEWSVPEQLSIPVRMLAQFFGSRLLFTVDRDLLKVAIFDEVGIYAAMKSAADQLNRIIRTGRGNRIACGIASQDARDLLALNVQNWLGRRYIGRVDDPEEGAAALKLGGLTTKEGYESSVLMNLSSREPGQFVFVDERRRAEVYRVDYKWWPSLHGALDRPRVSRKGEEWRPGASLV